MLKESFAHSGEGRLDFLWMEISRKCNLRCIHCYAESDPYRSHGLMKLPDWKRLILEASQIGVIRVQFIGGEPLLHPYFVELAEAAANTKMQIEVFSNMTRIQENHWNLFKKHNITLATSFYTFDKVLYSRITANRNGLDSTIKNIKHALANDIPLRVGIISVLPDQDVIDTELKLRDIGVSYVRTDRVRGVGRGQDIASTPDHDMNELCGACALYRAAVDPDGNVYPCVFARWLCVGNVQHLALSTIVFGAEMAARRDELTQHFSARGKQLARMETCDPQGCAPQQCIPVCDPGYRCPPHACNPQCFPG
jgi:MoaA/NifB/PqqE/SkfB family radical SAM enzyme